MTRFQQRRTPLIETAILASSAAVLWFDLITPLGVAAWIFFLVPLILSLYTWRPRLPILIAAACTLLIIFGFFFSPAEETSSGLARLNRSFGIVVLWGVAVAARQFIISKLEIEERDWVTAGRRELNTLMQGELSITQLAENVIRFLCQHLEAPVGAIYIGESDSTFRRAASYALASDTAAPDVIAPGEGLVGQAIKDNRILRVDNVPPGYLPVSSALGRADPRHIVIVPTRADTVTNGVLEFGFHHSVGRSDMDLLTAVAQPIGIAIRSAEYSTRQQELLEQTQRQAEALQTQQEELRVTNEELEEQSRALRESHARLEAQQAELEQTNSHLEDQAQTLELQKDQLIRAQAALTQKADELLRANQYKSEFLANMSHELRTPLNSALILAKLLADNKQGNLTPAQVEYATMIYAAGNDLLALINDILDLSRIEAGRLQMQPEPVALAAIVEAVTRTFEPVAQEKKLAFTAQIAPDTPQTITTDPLRLQQILKNLISNAFKFTERGEVALQISSPAPQHIAFAVRDTGTGIAADQQEVIFEAFRQADGSTHRRYGGTGLGLSISRELARRLGGRLEVDSVLGAGSTFTVVLPTELHAEVSASSAPGAEPSVPRVPVQATPSRPVAQPQAATSAAQRVPRMTASPIQDDRDNIPRGSRSILVVEDDPRFARILYDLAHELQFRCLIAQSGQEGLELAVEQQPSAILLDINLPDGSGLAVLEQLKHTAATRHIPVHVISVADYAQQALELGAIGYALKPISREQLVEAFRKLERKLEQRMRRVLVVEDADVQRESIVQLLHSDAVEIVAVRTGAEALQRLKESTFDCMVLDLTLPDLSGFELLDRMSADEAFSFPPVIIHTARSLTRDEEHRLRRYATSIIIKGARSPERLLDEVTLFLHQVERNLPPQQQRALRELRSRDAMLEGRRILLVEDDVRNVFALASILEPKGAKVEIARNGREALEMLERAARTGQDGGRDIDLVLMDIMMPEMDGLTAMREIRKRPEWKKLPIIALTAKAMADDRTKCLEAGANDYIPKPLDVEKLLSLVKVWMPK